MASPAAAAEVLSRVKARFQQQWVGNVRATLACSSLAGLGIAELRAEIVKASRRLVGQQVPTWYLELRNQITMLAADAGGNFVRYDALRSRVIHADLVPGGLTPSVVDGDEVDAQMRTALRVFHDAGLLLYYADLQDLIVVNPQWLANFLAT